MSRMVIETSRKQVMRNKTKTIPVQQLKRGFWKPEEDLILKNYVKTHGEGNWPSISQKSGLTRDGKSCRLRWKNYLRPNIKRGSMSQEEEDLIIRMHKLLGNRWSLIAGRLPGRTDNEVKNYWNTHLNKKRTTDCLHHANNGEEEDNKSSTANKRARSVCTSLPPTGSTSNATPNNMTQGHDDGRREGSAVIALSTDHPAWIEDLMSYNYGDVESSQVPPSHAAFLFDEDPFMPYFDSFLLLGALGVKVDINYMNPT